MLILDFKSFRSQVKGKHSISREFLSSSVRTETVDTDILETSMNGDKNHAIYHNDKQISLEDKEVEPAEPVQMNIYESNTYRKESSWLHFNNKSRI